jgi:hypothetical protein
MPQQQVLRQQVAPVAEGGPEHGQQEREALEHGVGMPVRPLDTL